MHAIHVENLGKAYKQYPSRWSRLAEWMLPATQPRHQLTWVLKNIHFTVAPGEAVGIIGVNGAGKSTLLKLITGTTLPTQGQVQISGRVAALLELGMGFHPDFTGRENAVMTGQLLGFSAAQMHQAMPQIESFAEIGHYIDLPVRVYSSGMQMRLAFAVATAHRPDILIIDEALSVGDTYFQHKSFDRIRQYSKEGTTLLLVSHDKIAIQAICDRAILLSEGRIAMEGDPQVVIDYYNALLADLSGDNIQQINRQDGTVQTISGDGEIIVTDIALKNDQEEQIDTLHVGQDVQLHITVQACVDIPELVLGYLIKDRFGQPVYGTNTWYLKHPPQQIRKDAKVVYIFHFKANLGIGSYSITTALHTQDSHIKKNYEWRDLALVFNVININQENFVGTAWLPPQLEYRP